RDLSCCKIIENTIYKANFFPKKSYLLKINGKGFGRHQIRLIMGALIKLGKEEIDLDYISKSLLINSSKTMDYIAPASGLILHKVKF
ncbi:tRNA pseudouridine(38-40) synthase TruA, partial [Flavobacteriaceae bacterium]|nr:tRNA pseudouridine(38-40) synthase TruA [Flavobacteriaceae bacterium]